MRVSALEVSTMSSLPRDPLTLRPEACERLTVKLPESTFLALYHYCLMHQTDVSRMPYAVARIVDVFLTRDATFRRWRDAQRDTLPSSVPRRSPRSPRRRGEHA